MIRKGLYFSSKTKKNKGDRDFKLKFSSGGIKDFKTIHRVRLTTTF